MNEMNEMNKINEMNEIEKYKQYTTEIPSTKYLGLISQASDRLLEFSQRLLHGSNFTIVKYGDGELRNMISKNEHDHNCDGNFYYRELGDELVQSYIYFLNNANSYICKWHSHEYLIQNKIEEDYHDSFDSERKFLYYDIIIHKLPISIEQLQFFKIVRYLNRPKLYISNGYMINALSPVLGLTHAIEIPMQNTYQQKDQLYEMIDNIMFSLDNAIIMTSAGMFSKVIIAHMSQKYPNNTYLDIGSSFDGLVRPSRDFMETPIYKSELIKHYAPELNNVTEERFKNYELALIHFDKYKTTKSQNILVLGSNGVIGKSLVKFLKSIGHNVTEWDITIDSKHDLRISCPELFNYDFIYFLAYDIGGSKYLSNQQIEFINNNILIMYNVFNKIKEIKDSHNKSIPFIFASSQMENMNNPYGTLKRLGEHYTELLGGISTRFWNVYGHEDYNEKSHVITDLIRGYKNNKCITLMTDGKEERQFLHTDDCARGLYTVHRFYDVLVYKKHIDVTNGIWTKIYDIALMITKEASKIQVSNKKDTVQSMKNEPDLYLNMYWKPEISLEEYIKASL
jgi:nucleoside-diphosphate-sugar epimerase